MICIEIRYSFPHCKYYSLYIFFISGTTSSLLVVMWSNQWFLLSCVCFLLVTCDISIFHSASWYCHRFSINSVETWATTNFYLENAFIITSYIELNHKMTVEQQYVLSSVLIQIIIINRQKTWSHCTLRSQLVLRSWQIQYWFLGVSIHRSWQFSKPSFSNLPNYNYT